MTASSVRIQRRRTKGFSLQTASQAINGLPAKYVGRPGKYGNPHKIGTEGVPDAAAAKRCYAQDVLRRFTIEDIEALAGFNLACWCPLDKPCHADVLLALVNNMPNSDISP